MTFINNIGGSVHVKVNNCTSIPKSSSAYSYEICMQVFNTFLNENTFFILNDYTRNKPQLHFVVQIVLKDLLPFYNT